jgi:hypothetical protein
VNENPLFPFGHGLSYTTFKYSNLRVFNRVITVDLANTGSVPGAEVVQVYLEVQPPPPVLRFAKFPAAHCVRVCALAVPQERG